MKSAIKLAAILLMAIPCAAQIPAPQIALTGNIGCQGFPCVNNGTLIFASDADHTMTARETSAFYIKLTSSVTLTATRNLRAPLGNFPFTIQNATTGGQSVQIVGPSGLGVTIANGATVAVWNNGTDYVQVGISGSYLSLGGGTLTGPLTGTSASFSGTVAALATNLVQHAEMFAGTTADAQISACIAAVGTGGTCDMRGYGATSRTIAATVTTVQKVSLIFDPATTFTAASPSIDMFAIMPDSSITGLTVDNSALGNYAGNVVKFPGTCGDGAPCSLTNFLFINGTVTSGITTGTAIQLKALSGVNTLAYVDIEHGRTVGFQNGIFLTSTGAIGSNYFVNDTRVNDVNIKNAVNCIYYQSNPGDIIGNVFVNSSCQSGPQSATGLMVNGVAGSNTYSNSFVNFNIWDYGYTSSQASYSYNAFTNHNAFMGNIVLGSMDTSSDGGTRNSWWNFSKNYQWFDLAGGFHALGPSSFGITSVPEIDMTDSGSNLWKIQPTTLGFNVVLPGTGANTWLGWNSVTTNQSIAQQFVGGNLLTSDPSCTSGSYWIDPIAGSTNNWRMCSNGTLSTLPTATTPLTGTTASIGGDLLAVGCTNETTLTVTGATTAMACVISGTAGNPANVQPQCAVTAANTVTPQLCTAVAVTPTARTYNVRILQ
jgi:hypothetical protein